VQLIEKCSDAGDVLDDVPADDRVKSFVNVRGPKVRAMKLD
jgi:hypothetical protein